MSCNNKVCSKLWCIVSTVVVLFVLVGGLYSLYPVWLGQTDAGDLMEVGIGVGAVWTGFGFFMNSICKMCCKKSENCNTK